MDNATRNRVAIVGVGHTPMVRKTDKSLGSFAAQAALQAIRDAGLRPSDIDGYAGNPVAMNPSARHWDGVDEVSGRYMVSTLGMSNVRWIVDMSRGLASDSIVEAIHALQSGNCKYVLVVRAMQLPGGGRYARTEAPAAGGPGQFSAPYGLDNGIGRTALWLNRYMHDYGATRKELYAVAQTLREHACLNPNAYWQKPLSEEEYLGAPQIFEPMTRFDCDIPVTGAAAVVLTTADRARDLAQKPAYISGLATDYEAPDTIYKVSGMGPGDIHAAQLYDGFLPFIWYWLERLQFCPKGEAHRFALDGNIKLGGKLPVTTFGGSVGEGRLNGLGHLCEGALQVMQRAGQRQVKGLSNCLVSLGFIWSQGIVMILTED